MVSSSAAVLIAHTIGRIAANDRATLTRSSRVDAGLRYSGTSSGAATSSATMIGTLMRNTDPHQNTSSSSPPTIGPSAIPPDRLAVQMPMALVRSAGSVNILRISDSVEGISVAPPIPMSARAAISTSGVGANAASADAAPNRAAPIIRSLRLPMRSPTFPMTMSSPASRKP